MLLKIVRIMAKELKKTIFITFRMFSVGHDHKFCIVIQATYVRNNRISLHMLIILFAAQKYLELRKENQTTVSCEPRE